ncbi:MAG TPA: hypothetical protein VFS00_12445, partial [Polyangiaceae bacterium]|nr:hypothetical protein [Polyangiaceae bacterium]
MTGSGDGGAPPALPAVTGGDGGGAPPALPAVTGGDGGGAPPALRCEAATACHRPSGGGVIARPGGRRR